MKRVAMLLVTVAALTWSVAPVVERTLKPPPAAAVRIPPGSLVGWAISQWDEDTGRITGALMGAGLVLRGARQGYVIGGMFGGLLGAAFGGALGGF